MPASTTMAMCVLAVVVLATWHERAARTNPWLERLRVLLPAWRFFDRVDTAPSLRVRFAAPDAAWGEWLDALAVPRHRWLLAPAGNLALAYHGVVARLVTEGELDGSPGQAVTLLLVTDLAREAVPTELRGRDGARWQWSIVDGDADRTVLARSPVLAA
ncbi:MAG: hypothetical protein IPK74_16715 [Deltaproteobacteria bacterium]|nr:hypothetical protein [Deltaproteobacteria bacterium]